MKQVQKSTNLDWHARHHQLWWRNQPPILLVLLKSKREFWKTTYDIPLYGSGKRKMKAYINICTWVNLIKLNHTLDHRNLETDQSQKIMMLLILCINSKIKDTPRDCTINERKSITSIIKPWDILTNRSPMGCTINEKKGRTLIIKPWEIHTN